jgi:meiotic recombination protein DMC1
VSLFFKKRVEAAQEKEDAVDQEQGETVSFVEIEEIQDLGVSAADIAKLKSAKMFTVGAVLMRPRKELMKVKGISEAKLDKIMEACGKLKQASFMTGGELLVKRQEVMMVTTGSSELDKLLGGGIETMSITECFGEFRTGKTQLAHTLCVTSQLPRDIGGGEGKVAYIDTEGTFRPERLTPIAERYGVDPEVCLDNVVYARAYTHDHQMQLISEIAAKMVEEPFRVLIIDSMTALFRAEFHGRGAPTPRQ